MHDPLSSVANNGIVFASTSVLCEYRCDIAAYSAGSSQCEMPFCFSTVCIRSGFVWVETCCQVFWKNAPNMSCMASHDVTRNRLLQQCCQYFSPDARVRMSSERSFLYVNKIIPFVVGCFGLFCGFAGKVAAHFSCEINSYLTLTAPLSLDIIYVSLHFLNVRLR